METPRIESELTAVSRCDAAFELYLYILRRTRKMMEGEFGKPTSYYSGEKECLITSAAAVYRAVVSPEILDNLQAIKDSKEMTVIEDVVLEEDDDPRVGSFPDYQQWEGES